MTRISHTYAQTNIQLYNQMECLGYSSSEIERITTGYRLAAELFTGQFRSSGKPFVNHLVGTASILVTLEQSLDVVIAGLLHAVYVQGDFGQNKPGISSAKTKQIQAAVGISVERYIAAYTVTKWPIRKPVEDLDEFERSVLIMRLADTLEDHLDLGVLYSSQAKRKSAGKHIENQIELAQKLNLLDIVDRLSEIRSLEKSTVDEVTE
ncbi:MAG: DUF6817 domain-containing protein, partial [Cyanobacteria bacterium P01_F01_bin.116]